METELKISDLQVIRQEINDLNNDFCYYLDHGMVDELVELFCEDALYTHGQRTSSGREEIRQLFKGRGAKNRTSRHIQSGLRIQVRDSAHAAGQSVCLTFGADAQPPVSPATPYLVADFIDEYQLCDDGRWRIWRRHIERIFVAEDNRGPEGQIKG
ncbi:MAG: nuclear transport factor 2 family protein [Desulfocapsaceae bacterium]